MTITNFFIISVTYNVEIVARISKATRPLILHFIRQQFPASVPSSSSSPRSQVSSSRSQGNNRHTASSPTSPAADIISRDDYCNDIIDMNDLSLDDASESKTRLNNSKWHGTVSSQQQKPAIINVSPSMSATTPAHVSNDCPPNTSSSAESCIMSTISLTDNPLALVNLMDNPLAIANLTDNPLATINLTDDPLAIAYLTDNPLATVNLIDIALTNGNVTDNPLATANLTDNPLALPINSR